MKTNAIKSKKAIKSVKKTSKAKKPAQNNIARIAELENTINCLQMRLDLAEAAIQAIRDGFQAQKQWPIPLPQWPNPVWHEWPIYSGVRSAGG